MGLSWEAVSSDQRTWELNLTALRMRAPAIARLLENLKPAHQYFKGEDPLRPQLARQVDAQIQPLPNPVPQSAATDIARKLFPGKQCTEPALVAGLDQGWLWQTLYNLPCHTPGTPGHRPPLYFLAHDIERLWVVMHLRDWSKLLADPRVQLFVGADAVEQCRRSMSDNPQVPWPKLSVTVDPSIWPAGVSVDSIWASAHQAANERMQELSRKIETIYGGMATKKLASRLRDQGLRVMGITSLYTSFLKYSMSDWLDAFTSMGHEGIVCIERADHEINNPLVFAKTAAEFQPDLILMIDHYRAEIPGLPQQIPCVMWVQDNLPNIFNSRAGAAQGLRDYCLGFGRLHLRDQFGYPEKRFMPAHVGVNESRFAPVELDAEDRQTYGCDVSFVSHASTPPTVLLTEQLQRTDAQGRKLLIDIFEQMRAVYDRGEAIPHASLINKMIQQSLFRLRYNVDASAIRSLSDFFTQRVNNALFRHQALEWAADLDLNMHLWGRGWEQHPQLGRFAKGIACNQSQLLKIYQASKINLQITPFGAVHQRLLDGLATGAFFLIRQCPGDLADRTHRKLWDWCNEHNIQTHAQFLDSMDAQVQTWLAEYKQFMGVGLLDYAPDVIAHLKLSADSGFTRSAGTVWQEYDQVSFDSRERLKDLAQHYLTDETARRHTARSMRQVVLDRFTYKATTRRLLEMIADDLAGHPSVREAAA